jgi:excisionase family DNA binding protein
MTAAVQESGLAQYVDLRTVTARTGIAYSTLRQWISSGDLKAYRLPGNQIRVRVEDVQAMFVPVQPKH